MGQSFLSRLKSLDAYARTFDEYSIKTTGGGIITLAASGSICALLAYEFLIYRAVELQPVLTVDRSRKQDLAITLNISFPSVPCFLLSVDAVDEAGEEWPALLEDIRKARLDRYGNSIEESGLKNLESQITCGECYEGDPPPSGCCHTCEDVIDAYQRKGRSLVNREGIAQCDRLKHICMALFLKCAKGYEAGSPPAQDFLGAEEGCNIAGKLQLKRVAGNFHVSPGVALTQHGKHIHDIDGLRHVTFNLSHHIHTLSFGEPVEGQVNPLDGISQVTYAPNYIYHYYIRVVGVEVRRCKGSTAHTNQYSVTRYEKPNLLGGIEQLPGFFVTYDISPLVVVYTEYHQTLAYFLTGSLSVIGGIFTVASLLDSAVFSAGRRLKRKIDLGKMF